MKREKLIYHPKVKEELQEASIYYESSKEGLGSVFSAAVESAIHRISLYPYLGRKISNTFRRVLIDKFPYGIIYVTESEEIYIIAIMHLKRKPNYWKKR